MRFAWIGRPTLDWKERSGIMEEEANPPDEPIDASERACEREELRSDEIGIGIPPGTTVTSGGCTSSERDLGVVEADLFVCLLGVVVVGIEFDLIDLTFDANGAAAWLMGDDFIPKRCVNTIEAELDWT